MHAPEYYSTTKMLKFVLFSNTIRTRGDYVKLNEPETERQLSYDLVHIWI